MSSIKTKARAWVVGGVAAAALVLSAANALAVFPDDHVASYAACLSTAGSAAGTFSRVAVGDAPASPCGSNQMLVHLSGGDITSVIAGPGLSGGGSNGSATLSLAAGQALPQTCSSGQIPEWNGTGWSCGDDNDTTYSNGTGLDLLGTTFSVKPGYRLPQSCSDGQVAKSNGSSWSCATDIAGGADAWIGSHNAFEHMVPRNDVLDLPLPEGNFTLVAKGVVFDVARDQTTSCVLTAGEDAQGVPIPIDETLFNTEDTGVDEVSFTLMATKSLPAGGAIARVICSSTDQIGSAQVGMVKLIATRVNALH
jgi:hypothetical protein